VRRKFFDVHAATGSPIAKEALDRIGQLYAVEKIINGLPPERRRRRRQLQSKPIAEALAAWAESIVRRQAFRYMRARWTALLRCFDDGRLALDNNPAERALRCVAMRRSLYPSSSSIWKHWKLVCRHDATRTTCWPNRGNDPHVLQLAGADLERSAGHHLLGREDTILNQAANLVISDTELLAASDIVSHSPVFARTVSMNAVHPPHRTEHSARSGLPMTDRRSHTVQRQYPRPPIESPWSPQVKLTMRQHFFRS